MTPPFIVVIVIAATMVYLAWDVLRTNRRIKEQKEAWEQKVEALRHTPPPPTIQVKWYDGNSYWYRKEGQQKEQ